MKKITRESIAIILIGSNNPGSYSRALNFAHIGIELAAARDTFRKSFDRTESSVITYATGYGTSAYAADAASVGLFPMP